MQETEKLKKTIARLQRENKKLKTKLDQQSDFDDFITRSSEASRAESQRFGLMQERAAELNYKGREPWE